MFCLSKLQGKQRSQAWAPRGGDRLRPPTKRLRFSATLFLFNKHPAVPLVAAAASPWRGDGAVDADVCCLWQAASSPLRGVGAGLLAGRHVSLAGRWGGGRGFVRWLLAGRHVSLAG
jgi:hypothetical protein